MSLGHVSPLHRIRQRSITTPSGVVFQPGVFSKEIRFGSAEKGLRVFELRVRAKFSSAHHLRGYEGDCSRPHGHTWMVEAFVEKSDLNPIGMAVDFKDIKGALRECVGAWDHQDLNALSDFKSINPTAENIAKILFDRLSGQFPVSGITVWESEDASVTYKR
jgi:6-pyruvoyltetrahydropterin/6-carboxytetrahydropterin synthase